ncbi:MAG TPA: zf-HC2 domain-containing protein [Actinospica sp.]|jgi:anti-sigma factor RsiW|nr:zf-HC2 domain-containing protein [Actinospica sp.]
MSEETHLWREELGAYLVGALDAEEAERMRVHLEGCPACRAEYAELAPVAGLLAKVPAEAFFTAADSGAAPDPAMWDRLRARAGLPAPGVAGSPSDVRLRANPTLPGGQRPGGPVRPQQPSPSTRPSPRRARRSMHPSTAALISGVLVAAAAFGLYAGTRPSTKADTAGIETVSAVNAADGVSGTVQYRPTDWGSWVQITLKGVKPGDDCVLYATDGHGNKAVASTWWAPSLTSEAATIPGGVAMDAADIKNFQVTTTAGEVLLTVPAS